MATDNPTPEPRRADKGGDDELAGTVFMSGNEVAWAGPDAVLGQQEEDDEEETADESEAAVATGEEHKPLKQFGQ
jgi:hypothetical protein